MLKEGLTNYARFAIQLQNKIKPNLIFFFLKKKINIPTTTLSYLFLRPFGGGGGQQCKHILRNEIIFHKEPHYCYICLYVFKLNLLITYYILADSL